MGLFGNGWTGRLVSPAAIAALVMAGCASSGGGASPPSMTTVSATGFTPGPAMSGSASVETAARGWIEDLVALGTGAAGDRGIWRTTGVGRWALVLPAPTATAVARFGDALALAGPGFVETMRPDGTATPAPLPLGWTAVDAGARIAAVARAPGGRLAVVTSQADALTFFVAGGDGTLRRFEQAPSQSFAPSVAWLDDDRLLVLATDGSGASTLKEINVTDGSLGRVGAGAGLRDFALSGDSATLAAVTARSILVGAADEFLGGSPRVVAAVPDGEVAWALALDRTGSVLVLVEAVVADDGTAARPHLVVLQQSGGEWTPRADEPLPFTAITGLAWVPRM